MDKITTSSFLYRNVDESIDENICCMCFGSYENNVNDHSGTNRIFRNCGRRLHEDCVDNVVKESDGVE